MTDKKIEEAKRHLEATKAEAKKKIDQAKARLQKFEARNRQNERKKDTRRKIILGGMMIADARKDPAKAEVLKSRIAALPDRDRAVFDGWDLTTGDGDEPENDKGHDRA